MTVKYVGCVMLRGIEFEVPDGADDVDVETAFNDAVQARMDGGYQSTDDYDYEEVDEDYA